MDFDPHKALAYARALARPRLVGSGEDEKVAKEVVAQLEGFGYQVEREPFQYSRAYDLALQYEIGLTLVLVALGLLWLGFLATSALLTLLVLVSVFFINTWIQRRAVAPDPNPVQRASPVLSWGRLYRTANIVARPRPTHPVSTNSPHLYLVAHFDSKSQRMPIVIRVILFSALLVSLILFVVTGLAIADLGWLPQIMGLIVLLSGAPLLFLDVGNESPGALDNGSGMGLVLHLAEVLSTRSDLLEAARFTVLITSAEEMATLGALFHVQRHLADLHRDGRSLTILNFDGVGAEGRLSHSGWGRVVVRLAATARTLNIRMRPFRFPGLLFDHIPFESYGFNAATLMTIGSSTWGVHTAHDTVDKLSISGFDQAGRVALKVIEQLATGQKS